MRQRRVGPGDGQHTTGPRCRHRSRHSGAEFHALVRLIRWHHLRGSGPVQDWPVKPPRAKHEHCTIVLEADLAHAAVQCTIVFDLGVVPEINKNGARLIPQIKTNLQKPA